MFNFPWIHIKIFFLFCTLALAQGCSFSINPHDFRLKDIDALHVPFHNKGDIAIEAYLVGASDRKNHVPAGDIVVNDDEFTKVLVKKLKKILNIQSADVVGSDKVITLQVNRVSIQPLLTINCVIDYNLKFGQGRFYGFQARASNWNYETACEMALSKAAINIINYRETIHYLKGK
jgi:hypothetical protein